MRIIVISGMFKIPAGTGGERVMLDYIIELSKHYNVTLLYPGTTNFTSQLKPYAIECITFDEIRNKYNIGINFTDKVSLWLLNKNVKKIAEKYFVGYYPYIKRYLKDFFSTNKNNTIIQVDFPWLMGIVNFIKHKIPVVFVVHEIQFVKHKREALICQNTGDIQKMAENLKLSKKYEKYELNELSKYDAVLTLSKIDKNVLQSKKIKSKIFESTLGIDISQIEKLQHNYFDKLVFIGNGAHFPNLDALVFYKEKILPLLNKVLPDIKLYVTGKYEQSFIEKFNDEPNIVWCGFVDNLNELLLNSISIVPVRIGSGIRIKILEAMARGCPVVTTEIGIEGIDVVNGKHAIIANDADNFVKGIYSIVSQKSLASEMSFMSRAFVEKYYNVKQNTNKRINLFKNEIYK